MNYHIQANGRVVKVFPANGKEFTLAELHNYVGGWIETISAPRLRGGSAHWSNGFYWSWEIKPDSILVLNEEGRLLELPLNHIATMMYLLGDFDPIVGDVLLTTRRAMAEDGD